MYPREFEKENVSFYLARVIKPVIVAAILLIGFRFIELIDVSIRDSIIFLEWFFKAIVFIYLGIKEVSGTKRFSSATLGFIAGFVLGAIMAIFSLLWYHKLWTVFNLLTEPLLTGIAGTLIVGVVRWLRGFYSANKSFP